MRSTGAPASLVAVLLVLDDWVSVNALLLRVSCRQIAKSFDLQSRAAHMLGGFYPNPKTLAQA